jgi:Sec-independent protein translocase protein TatA
MDILGIGPLELVFILIIALIVLGPTDMVKAGRTIGKFLRQIVTSPTWHAVTKTSSELRNLPNKLIRDAGLEEDIKQIQDVTKSAIPSSLNSDLKQWQRDINSWTTPPATENSANDAELEEIPPPDGGSDSPETQIDQEARTDGTEEESLPESSRSIDPRTQDAEGQAE